MLTAIVGPMFSGKSTELLRRLERARIAGKRVVLIKPEEDIRKYLTHNGLETSLKTIYLDNLRDFGDWDKYDVIGIDEGQLLKGLTIVTCFGYNKGRHILVAGLTLTSERKLFADMLTVMAEAEEIVRLNAVCMRCGSEYGTYSFYKFNDKDRDIKVGGEEDYEALCRECYFEAEMEKIRKEFNIVTAL
jgi:thymidine kinase